MRALVSTLLVVGSFGSAAQLAGQDRPAGWMIRADADGDPTSVSFVDMPPGWHVTTGPCAILWNGGHTVGGEFTVEVETYLFDPGPSRQAFGVFVGGRNLGGDVRYVKFVVREGGQFAVYRRIGSRLEPIVPWQATEAMVSFADKSESAAAARNVLAVEAGRDEVRFLVNGVRVAELARERLDVAGIVGLRVEERLNLHIARLDIQRD